MRPTRQTFCWVFVIGLLFATVSCGQADNSVEGDGYDDSFGIASGMGDSLVPEENSAEARALLEVVNTYSLHGLIRDVAEALARTDRPIPPHGLAQRILMRSTFRSSQRRRVEQPHDRAQQDEREQHARSHQDPLCGLGPSVSDLVFHVCLSDSL